MLKAVLVIAALCALASASRSKRDLISLRKDAISNIVSKSTFEPRAKQEDLNKGKPQSTISFSDPRAQKFYVDGSKIPDVHLDLGPSWSGLMPISDDPNETRKLFFWFWPSKDAKHVDDLVFWTNGGPGCSSLEGLTQENGPFTWSWGTAEPMYNQWSWTNLTHMLWVEQPVGTGFSQGEPNIHNEEELAAQVAGFLNQFLSVFKELKGKNFYVSGESYAGMYVPYIANYLYEHPGKVPLKLKGTWVTSPSISWDLVTEYIPALDYVLSNKAMFSLEESQIAEIQAANDKCGYTNFTQKYVTYPPAGPIPLPQQAYTGDRPNYQSIKEECKTWDMVFNAAIAKNPNFNVYRISDSWPVLWDILGFPGSFPNAQSPIYFARRDVQDAIHAPHIDWEECSSIDVFVNKTDTSLPSYSVYPNVIEKSERTVIMHGLFDYVLIHDGTKTAIQNMTWGGAQGFQTPIEPESFKIEGFGAIGAYHQERKLTYAEVVLAGHMMPQFAPWAAYKTLAYLLGRTELNSTALDASLLPNDYQLYGPYAPPDDGSRKGPHNHLEL